MSRDVISACVAGLVSSGLFLLVFGIGLGFVFMFLPSLPLLLIGLSKKPRLTHIAVGSAVLLIGLIAGLASGLLYLVFLGLPSWYFARKLAQTLPDGSPYPAGLVLMNLSVYACALIATMTLYYTGQPGGLPQLMSQNIHEAFSDLQGEYGDIIEQMANHWAFLMFPITIWLWGIILYGHVWLANLVLNQRNAARRADVSLAPFQIPAWMLSLLAIAALASLIGSPTMSFFGKSALLSLLLPYFFAGCTLMHQIAKTWPSHRFFLFFIYFMVLTQFWPALILAGFGLWKQIKYLSGAGTSSNN